MTNNILNDVTNFVDKENIDEFKMGDNKFLCLQEFQRYNKINQEDELTSSIVTYVEQDNDEHSDGGNQKDKENIPISVTNTTNKLSLENSNTDSSNSITETKRIPESTQRFLDLLDLAVGKKPANGYSVLKDRIQSLSRRSTAKKYYHSHGSHFGGLGVKNIVKHVETKHKTGRRDCSRKNSLSHAINRNEERANNKNINVDNSDDFSTLYKPIASIIPHRKKHPEGRKIEIQSTPNQNCISAKDLAQQLRACRASMKSTGNQLAKRLAEAHSSHNKGTNRARPPWGEFCNRGTFVITGTRGLEFDLDDSGFAFDLYEKLDPLDGKIDNKPIRLPRPKKAELKKADWNVQSHKVISIDVVKIVKSQAHYSGSENLVSFNIQEIKFPLDKVNDTRTEKGDLCNNCESVELTHQVNNTQFKSNLENESSINDSYNSLQNKAKSYIEAVEKSTGLSNNMTTLQRPTENAIITERSGKVNTFTTKGSTSKIQMDEEDYYESSSLSFKSYNNASKENSMLQKNQRIKEIQNIDIDLENKQIKRAHSEEILYSVDAETNRKLETSELEHKHKFHKLEDSISLENVYELSDEEEAICEEEDSKEILDEVHPRLPLDDLMVDAVIKNDPTKVRQLLLNGAEPNVLCCRSNNTVLHKAATMGHLYVVQALLKAGAKVETKTDLGNTALHLATRNGHEEVALQLLVSGANVNASNGCGITPLQQALAFGHLTLIHLLLRHQADCTQLNRIQESANDMAQYLGYGSLESPIKIWCDQKGTRADSPDKEVPIAVKLLKGVEDGCPAEIERCLEEGASANTLVPLALHWPAHATVLHRAAHHGQELVIRLLIQRGADINAKDVVGNTPLHAAAQAGYNRGIKVLLEAGAVIDETSQSEMTPLHRAASKGKEHTVKLLLRRGANSNAMDSKGKTPAEWAYRRGYQALGNFLVQKQLQNIATKLMDKKRK